MRTGKLNETAKRYETELLESVVPFWENHCVDTEYGGYHTMLDRGGSVYDTEKFMWMQWRVVYMFAILAESGYGTTSKRSKWLEIAEKGFDFLTKNGKDENGNYYFALSRSGEPAVAPYNIYSECFAAMGSAALCKATGGERFRSEAFDCIRKYLARMHDSKGHWNKEMSGRPARLAFGHFMILANLADEIGRFLETDEFKEDVKRAVETVDATFWNEDLGVMFESVNIDGFFDMETSIGRHVIPGHGLEALWFLMRYADENGDERLAWNCAERVKRTLEFGWDGEHGGLYYFMDALGKPHFELQSDMKLWWVHNEAMIAALYGYKLSGDSELLDWFWRLDEWSWRRFPDPEHGEWFGYLHRSGDLANMLKGGRWKTFFHLPRFLLVSLSLLDDLATKTPSA